MAIFRYNCQNSLLPLGLLLAIATIFQIAGLFISIVGIPVALVLAKTVGTYFNPINKICVPKQCKMN